MSNWYALGVPGEVVRQFVMAESAEAAAGQLLEREVALLAPAPSGAESSIAADGLTILVTRPVSDIDRAWADIRLQRDALLNANRWAWSDDSPLSTACRAEWLEWAHAMHRLTISFGHPREVVWPPQPSLTFSTEPA